MVWSCQRLARHRLDLWNSTPTSFNCKQNLFFIPKKHHIHFDFTPYFSLISWHVGANNHQQLFLWVCSLRNAKFIKRKEGLKMHTDSLTIILSGSPFVIHWIPQAASVCCCDFIVFVQMLVAFHAHKRHRNTDRRSMAPCDIQAVVVILRSWPV